MTFRLSACAILALALSLTAPAGFAGTKTTATTATKSQSLGGFPKKYAPTRAERRKLYQGSRAGVASR